MGPLGILVGVLVGPTGLLVGETLGALVGTLVGVPPGPKDTSCCRNEAKLTAPNPVTGSHPLVALKPCAQHTRPKATQALLPSVMSLKVAEERA